MDGGFGLYGLITDIFDPLLYTVPINSLDYSAKVQVISQLAYALAVRLRLVKKV